MYDLNSLLNPQKPRYDISKPQFDWSDPGSSIRSLANYIQTARMPDILDDYKALGFISPFEYQQYMREGKLESPEVRLQASAMQPGNTLAQSAHARMFMGGEPFNESLESGKVPANFWDAAIKSIMYRTPLGPASVKEFNLGGNRERPLSDESLAYRLGLLLNANIDPSEVSRYGY